MDEREDGTGLFERHISIGSILAIIASVGSAAGVYATVKSDLAVTRQNDAVITARIERLEQARESDRKELYEALRSIDGRLSDIQVSLATKQDIRDSDERRRPMAVTP